MAEEGESRVNRGKISVQVGCLNIHVVQWPTFLSSEEDDGAHGRPLDDGRKGFCVI